MKRPFSLSPRLQTVADLVSPAVRLADVGTDHGRLPVWLILHSTVRWAIASDVRHKPLRRAVALAERWGVREKISFRLCDGLTGIAPHEVETVTVTGMGGETIAGILAAADWPSAPAHQYILQPMSGVDGLRRYLNRHRFRILREHLAEERGTLYVILQTAPGDEPAYSEGEIWVGRQREGNESPLRNRYLTQELQKLRHAVAGLERSARPEDAERLCQYRQALRETAALKEEWETWYP